MRPITFFAQLTAITALLSVALYILHLFHPFDQVPEISAWSVPVFVVYTTAVFYAFYLARKSNSYHSLTQIIILSMMAKMVVCVGLIVVYVQVYSPSTKVFVIPFILTYLVYTIFEIIFMTELNHDQASHLNKNL